MDLKEPRHHHLWSSAFVRPHEPIRVFLVSPRPQLSLHLDVVGNHILLRNHIEILSICRKVFQPSHHPLHAAGAGLFHVSG